MSRSYDSMIKKLHSTLKIDDLWPQFLQALSVELDSYLIDVDLTKNYKNIYFDYQYYFDGGFPNTVYEEFLDGGYPYTLYPATQDEIFVQNMKRLAVKYGYNPNLILIDSPDFLRMELLSIAYRIVNKTTYNGFLFPLKEVLRKGEVYNFIYNDSKLVKTVVWGSEDSEMDSILKWYATHSTSDFILPFTNVYSDRNYQTVVDNRVLLDTGRTLDETPSWYLDGTKYAPTKHIGIEYYIDQIITKQSVEYLLYNDFFRYIEQSSDYNRHMNVVTHTGATLNFVAPPSQAYNFFDNTKSYTIPDLKLKAQSTFAIGSNTLDAVKYISVGTGTRSIPSTVDASIFLKQDTLFSYSMQPVKAVLLDSSGSLNATLYGDTTPINGTFGEEVFFNGSTYVLSDSTFSTTDHDYTLTGWFKYSERANTYDCILDCGLFKITLNTVTKHMYVYLGGVQQIGYTLSGQSTTDNIINFAIAYSAASSLIALAINGVFVISTSADYTFTYPSKISFGVSLTGGTTPSNDFFTGVISNVCLFNRKLLNPELLNIYTNRLTFNVGLGNRVYRAEVSKDEKALSVNWSGVNTYVPSFAVNDKMLFRYYSPNTNYKGFVGNTIVPNTFKITYQDTKNNIIFDQQILDDGTGVIKNDVIQGTIDYTTGAYDLQLFRISDSNFYDTVENEIKIIVTNENHVFPYSNTGVINYQNSGTSIMVWEGNTALSVDQTASFGNGTFRVTYTNPTNIKVGTMSGEGTNTLTFSNPSQLSGEYANIIYTIVVKNKAGIETTYERTQYFSKSTNSKTVKLISNDYAFTYNEEGTLPSPTGTTFYASSFNMVGVVYYDFLINGVSTQNSTASTFSYTPPTSMSSLPQTVRVDVRQSSSTGSVVASDSVQLVGVNNAVFGSTFSTNLLSEIGHTNVDIITKSVKITYKIKDSYYYVVDGGDSSGDNNILGIALEGKIDYGTGEITLATTADSVGEKYKLQAPIQIAFQYKKYTDLVDESFFSAEYKTNDNIMITEMALEDENKQALVYATFPPVEFNSLENYLAFNVMLPIVS